MNFIKLVFLFILIIITNISLMKIDFSKFFKRNSTQEIKIFVILLSFGLAYLVYKALIEFYELSLNLI